MDKSALGSSHVWVPEGDKTYLQIVPDMDAIEREAKFNAYARSARSNFNKGDEMTLAYRIPLDLLEWYCFFKGISVHEAMTNHEVQDDIVSMFPDACKCIDKTI